MIRPPAVANQFYDEDPERLSRQLDYLLTTRAPVQDAIAVVSPHAGYIYSGHVAGAVFARVRVPDTVVIIGPSHTGIGSPGAVMLKGAWSTPLGLVPIREDLAKRIVDICPFLEEDVQAHLYEHSLEVQVPFLQKRNPNVSIIPICLAGFNYAECEQIGLSISRAIKDFPEKVLIVASTDMTHYEPVDQAEAKDRLAIERILSLDPKGLLNTVRVNNITMCGVIPTTVTLVAALDLGATKAELVKYATSGDINGNYSQVVGYAGLVIY